MSFALTEHAKPDRDSVSDMNLGGIPEMVLEIKTAHARRRELIGIEPEHRVHRIPGKVVECQVPAHVHMPVPVFVCRRDHAPVEQRQFSEMIERNRRRAHFPSVFEVIVNELLSLCFATSILPQTNNPVHSQACHHQRQHDPNEEPGKPSLMESSMGKCNTLVSLYRLLLRRGVPGEHDPHLVNGISGLPFQSPFASPPGQGLSSSTVNVLWGTFNLVVAYGLVVRVGRFDLRSTRHVLVLGLGAFVLAFSSHAISVNFTGARTDGPTMTIILDPCSLAARSRRARA